MTRPLFTIGHSDRTLEEFLEILRAHKIAGIVDVRRLPGSRKYPWFNADELAASLAAVGVTYHRIEELAGRRPVSKDVPFEVNEFWQNRSFHNYADYALGGEFRRGLVELRELRRERRTAVMCAEAVWWRCHRRLIADYLLAGGDEVIHLMSARAQDPAKLTRGAVVGADGTVIYPAGPGDQGEPGNQGGPSDHAVKAARISS